MARLKRELSFLEEIPRVIIYIYIYIYIYIFLTNKAHADGFIYFNVYISFVTK
jgi:hypothetical protein